MSVFSALNALIETYYGDAASDSPSEKLYGDHVNANQPSSGPRKPHKTYIRSYLRIIERLVEGNRRLITSAGDRIVVDNDTATNINFPTTAARITATGGLPIRVKNRNANSALYPLQPVLSGGNTIDGSSSPLPQDSDAEVSYWPMSTGDWEIRSN